jgi:hypothetical protein
VADYLLHQGATVWCFHPPGQAFPTTFSLRVRVSGQPVVTQPTMYSIVGCGLAATGTAPPCATATWITAAARVRADGVPVLLRSSQATCIPTGTGVNVLQLQMRVRGT